MGQLIFIRHGQASFFEENYDKLSELGEEQCRKLADYWLTINAEWDAVYTGPRERQKTSAIIIGEVYRKAGVPWPPLIEMPEFDEHQVDQLTKTFANHLCDKYPQLEKLHQDLQTATGPKESHRAFQLLFQEVLELWLKAEPETDLVETWSQFESRVERGLKQVVDSATGGRRIAVFSSAGAITVAMKKALESTAEKAFDLGWRVRNASLTGFLFSNGRFSLDHFNTLPHLTDKNLWTFR